MANRCCLGSGVLIKPRLRQLFMLKPLLSSKQQYDECGGAGPWQSARASARCGVTAPPMPTLPPPAVTPTCWAVRGGSPSGGPKPPLDMLFWETASQPAHPSPLSRYALSPVTASEIWNRVRVLLSGLEQRQQQYNRPSWSTSILHSCLLCVNSTLSVIVAHFGSSPGLSSCTLS